MDLGYFLLARQAYATGWLVAAPIGPVNLEIIRRSLRDRLMAGFSVGLGAVTIDVCYLTVFSLGVGAFLEITWLRTALFLVGGGFLALLGVLAVRDAAKYLRKHTDQSAVVNGTPAPIGTSFFRGYLVGLAMTGSNPMTIAFWSALSLQFADLPLGGRLAASAALFAGCLSWVLTLMVILRFARAWIGPRLFGLVTLAGGGCLLYFGGKFLISGIGLLSGR